MGTRPFRAARSLLARAGADRVKGGPQGHRRRRRAAPLTRAAEARHSQEAGGPDGDVKVAVPERRSTPQQAHTTHTCPASRPWPVAASSRGRRTHEPTPGRRDVAILFVPGLLQTEHYARAVFSSRVPELTPDELELRVRHRMARQEIAIPYEVVIHEAALRFRVSDRVSSQAQLARLVELSEADHISLRVIPFDLDGFARASSTMKYVGGLLPKLDTVVRDAPHGSVFIDSEAQLNAYRTRFRKVEAVALDPERSRDFIHRLAKEL
ncbi:DUF5753 domain-containing protein [Streptomyces sp. NPDC005808]|uniref:DUF5753 domain-containing protein n=1 Tax=Streptomyces sp. NPDC005808 TaxID=3364734 RepID=UPI0036C61169